MDPITGICKAGKNNRGSFWGSDQIVTPIWIKKKETKIIYSHLYPMNMISILGVGTQNVTT